ncbi:MAG: 30S ribosomal protein S12 methylthiotransferase RimO [bacterium]|nr:30S ribosomal protein S12 methylthiotransferase RimO [bacterium]
MKKTKHERSNNHRITFSIISLGCPKNLVDSEIVIGTMQYAGYRMVSDIEKADILLVNTCAFIQPAIDESFQTIRDLVKLKQTQRNKKLFILGCLPQREQETILTKFPEIDGLVGVGEFYQIVNLIKHAERTKPIIAIAQPTFIYTHTTPRQLATQPHTAYVKIAEGCNHYCSFCTIPRIRGRFRSRPIESIVAEVTQLTRSGVKEINLIAQDITAYGSDLYNGYALVLLLNKLVKIPELRWLRLLYTNPANFSDELIEVIAREDKICKYIDMPIQHIDDTILKQMNRNTSSQQIKTLLAKLRNRIPNITIRTSLLVGFPGESDRQFQRLVKFIQEQKFDRLGVFPYSREKQTTAYYLKPQLPKNVKQRRAEIIMQIQYPIVLQKNQMLLGKEMTILLDTEYDVKERIYIGRSEFHAPDIDGVIYVWNKSKRKILPGDIISAKIVDMNDYDLIAEC